MPAPLISRDEAERRFALVRGALEAGGKLPGEPINERTGERGALRLALDAAATSWAEGYFCSDVSTADLDAIIAEQMTFYGIT